MATCPQCKNVFPSESVMTKHLDSCTTYVGTLGDLTCTAGSGKDVEVAATTVFGGFSTSVISFNGAQMKELKNNTPIGHDPLESARSRAVASVIKTRHVAARGDVHSGDVVVDGMVVGTTSYMHGGGSSGDGTGTAPSSGSSAKP